MTGPTIKLRPIRLEVEVDGQIIGQVRRGELNPRYSQYWDGFAIEDDGLMWSIGELLPTADDAVNALLHYAGVER